MWDIDKVLFEEDDEWGGGDGSVDGADSWDDPGNSSDNTDGDLDQSISSEAAFNFWNEAYNECKECGDSCDEDDEEVEPVAADPADTVAQFNTPDDAFADDPESFDGGTEYMKDGETKELDLESFFQSFQF